jgi:hypothetical protein
LTRLVRALGAPRPLSPSPHLRTAGCPAGQTRLTAGGKTWSWAEGCGDYPSVALERLVHFMRRQTYARHADPAANVVLVLRDGALLDPRSDAPVDELIIRSDGSWTLRRAGVERQGRLGANALANISQLAEKARPDFATDEARCRARPTAWHHLQVPGVADTFWRTPCAPRPGAALEALVRAAREAVLATRGGLAPERPEAPMLVVGRGDASDLAKPGYLPELLRVMPDGTWIKGDGTRGRIDRTTLDGLADAIARTRFEVAPVDPGMAMCLAIPTEAYELAAGDGRWVRWTGPCAPPPHPTVAALMQLVSGLVP